MEIPLEVVPGRQMLPEGNEPYTDSTQDLPELAIWHGRLEVAPVSGLSEGLVQGDPGDRR